MSIKGIGLDSLSSPDSEASHSSHGHVARRLKLIPETFGISQRELAKRAGVTNSSISMIELGQVSPSIQSLERILAVIPISLSDFFAFQSTSTVRVNRASNLSFSGERNLSQTGDQLNSRMLVIPVNNASGLGLPECDTAGLVVAGIAQLKIIAATEQLSAGDSFYIPARQLHQFINSGEVPLQLFICSRIMGGR